MTRKTCGLWLVALFCTAGVARAQAPAKFTNLQVLDKSISRDDLMSVMRGFSFSLGLRCENCHVGQGGTRLEQMDFAADDKETKRTARTMLRMVQAINTEYVGKLADPEPVRVECVTCHRGLSKPRTLRSVLAETLETKDIPTAVALYRDLRKKYYGGAQYDFTETSMNQLGESLLRRKKSKEAAAMMELNAEVNAPLSAWGFSVLAMAHQANGDTEKAIADFQRIIELRPDDTWAKKQLEELRSRKP